MLLLVRWWWCVVHCWWVPSSPSIRHCRLYWRLRLSLPVLVCTFRFIGDGALVITFCLAAFQWMHKTTTTNWYPKIEEASVAIWLPCQGINRKLTRQKGNLMARNYHDAKSYIQSLKRSDLLPLPKSFGINADVNIVSDFFLTTKKE